MKLNRITAFNLISLFLTFSNVEAQKLNLVDLVNAIYKSQIKLEKIDTIFFVSECNSDFFVTETLKNPLIKMLAFPSKELFKSYVKLKRSVWFLKHL